MNFEPRIWQPDQPVGSGERFYVYPQLLRHALAVRRCFEAQPHLHNLSRTQYLFELEVVDAVLRHPLRTRDRREASAFVLPLLGVASRQAGQCTDANPHGEPKRHAHTDHAQRMRAALQLMHSEVDFSAGPHVLPCTCTMQRSTYGAALFDLLSNHSHQLVSLTHARKAPPLNVARLHVFAPYHSAPAFYEVGRRRCEEVAAMPTAVTFSGSPQTTRQGATCAPQRSRPRRDALLLRPPTHSHHLQPRLCPSPNAQACGITSLRCGVRTQSASSSARPSGGRPAAGVGRVARV
jgi:hypothetical protein